MVQANMGIGLIPDRAFSVIGGGMGLRSIVLRDSWARRELKIVVREVDGLSQIGRLVLDHLRAAEQSGGEPVRQIAQPDVLRRRTPD
jgi:hypothetical protein